MPAPEHVNDPVADPVEQEVTQTSEDILDMSDEAFEALMASGLPPEQDTPEQDDAAPAPEPAPEPETGPENKAPEKEDPDKEDDQGPGPEDDGDSRGGDDPAPDADLHNPDGKEDGEPDDGPASRQPSEKKGAGNADDPDTGAVDYAAEYTKLMAPFKANGSEMTVKSVDDARSLMQMGANYHKKMAGLKPSLKTLKLLEKNKLLDPEKLNFLIDVSNKNPEAITKLLKDSGIDPLDINIKAESSYTPTQRKVTDKEIDLDSVLEEVRGTETYERTLNVVSREWDDASRDAIATAPQIISIINGHIADGTYDKVMERVTYERSLGRLQGMSDFDAYKSAGDVLAAEGKLSVPGQPQQPVSQPSKAEPSKAEKERQKRKKAAAPTKQGKAPAQPTFNPLEMSDEEFAKFDPKQFQIL